MENIAAEIRQEVRQMKWVVRRSKPVVTKGAISTRTVQSKQSEAQAQRLQQQAILRAAIQAKALESQRRESVLAARFPEVR